MITDIQGKISDINLLYKKLSTLSHNELRHKFNELRKQIKSSNTLLDELLIEVFAIVKDTMRRFAENEKIEVVANKIEREIAEKCDYLNVEDNTAIYSNKWIVVGEHFVWNMIPYDEQLQGGIELHNGKIIQMATGEGKTLVAIAPAILNALSDKKVHIMTVNDYLSRRDFEITRPIYSFLGLTTGCLAGLTTSGRERKMAYLCDITFGSNSDFIFDYLFDNISNSANKCVQRKHDFCIIDEADSVLIDEAQTPHIVGDGDSDEGDDENLYTTLLPLVKSLLCCNEENKYYIVDSLRHTITLTDIGKNWLSENIGDSLLYDTEYYKKEIDEIKATKNISEEQQRSLLEVANNKHYHRLKLQNVINQLLKALTILNKDSDYIVENNKIVIIDRHTGRPKYGHIWQHGLHEAVMAKEDIKAVVGTDFIRATISVKNYISMYHKLSGMTGTAISAKDEFKEIYNLDVAFIPTHKISIREDKPLRIFKTTHDKKKAILLEVEKLHSQHRPILIGVNSIGESNKIGSLLTSVGYEIMLLNAQTLREEASIISRAGMLDSITVATSVAGRGTDIKPPNESLLRGGLAVIGINIASSKRVDEQLIGRSGRQGNPGTSQFFVSIEDEIIGYLPNDKKEELVNLSQENIDGEIMSLLAKDIFAKAQTIEEEEDRQQRKKVADKDDAIDAHRRFIYETRMTLLEKDCDVETTMNDILSSYNEPSFASQRKANNGNIIAKSLPIIGQAIINMHTIEKTSFIPILYNNELFVIECNFEEVLKSRGDILIKEIYRQLTLKIIDKYWTMFINTINTNLIQTIEYEQIYQKIYKQMGYELMDALLHIRVTIWERENNYRVTPFKKESLSSASRKDVINPTGLCPCGSEKPYYMCHGVNR